MADLFGRTWTQQELRQHVGDVAQLAGVRPITLSGGRSHGVRALEVYTGSGLAFRVLTDRALDISACTYKGIPLHWAAPAGEIHPAYYEPEDTGWLRSFPGGLVSTCGLDQFGAPSRDAGGDFGLHGRISNLPAEQTNWSGAWVGDDYEIEIHGQVRQARLFGENLLLERCIRTRLGARWFRLEDTVTNEGFDIQPHMILYHCNLGFPLVDKASRLCVDTTATVPRDLEAEAGLQDWMHFQAPTPAYREQVFHHQLRAEKNGTVTVRVESPTAGLALNLRYELASLPHLYEWKMMGQGAYVLGLEPANCAGIEGRAAARELNDLPELEPGEKRRYSLVFEIEELRL